MNYSTVEHLVYEAEVLKYMYDSADFEIKYFVAVMTAIQFLRIILQMKMSKTFGPMVKILTLMIWDLIVYIALMGTIFFIF